MANLKASFKLPKSMLFVSATLLLMLVVPAQAFAWAKYQSPNFTVYTDRRESQVRSLLDELEIFRVIAMLQLNLPVEQRESQKLTIIMFGRNRDFQRILGERNVAGFFLNSSQGPRMVIGAGRSNVQSAKEILFHEYVHHLMFEHSAGFTYPRWYVEGLAELLGATRVERDSVVVGGRPGAAVALDYMGALRMEDLLRNRRRGEGTNDYEARFYATSWLLTHYLQIDAESNELQLGLKGREYLVRFHRGDDPVTAFEEVFETSLGEFDRVLSRYARQRRITVRNWTRPELEFDVIRTDVSETEKGYVMADTASAAGNEPLALDYLNGIDGSDDYFAEALALQAVVLNHDDSSREAAAQSAAQAASVGVSAATAGYLAHYEMDNYHRLLESGQAGALAALDRAEAHARRGTELGERDFNSLWYLASVMMIKDRPDTALQLLDAAWDVMPANVGVRL